MQKNKPNKIEAEVERDKEESPEKEKEEQAGLEDGFAPAETDIPESLKIEDETPEDETPTEDDNPESEESLIARYSYLPRVLALKEAARYPELHLDIVDLIGEGWFGLIRAARTYDPEKGSGFSHYASIWIGQYMKGRLSHIYLVKLSRKDAKTAARHPKDSYDPSLSWVDLDRVGHEIADTEGYFFPGTGTACVNPDMAVRLNKEKAETLLEKGIAILSERDARAPYIINTIYGSFGFPKISAAEACRKTGMSPTSLYRLRAKMLRELRKIMDGLLSEAK